jgi:hypothetical protein
MKYTKREHRISKDRYGVRDEWATKVQRPMWKGVDSRVGLDGGLFEWLEIFQRLAQIQDNLIVGLALWNGQKIVIVEYVEEILHA